MWRLLPRATMRTWTTAACSCSGPVCSTLAYGGWSVLSSLPTLIQVTLNVKQSQRDEIFVGFAICAKDETGNIIFQLAIITIIIKLIILVKNINKK